MLQVRTFHPVESVFKSDLTEKQRNHIGTTNVRVPKSRVPNHILPIHNHLYVWPS